MLFEVGKDDNGIPYLMSMTDYLDQSARSDTYLFDSTAFDSDSLGHDYQVPFVFSGRDNDWLAVLPASQRPDYRWSVTFSLLFIFVFDLLS